MLPGVDLLDSLARLLLEHGQAPGFIGVGDVDEVMGGKSPFCQGRLGGADIHVAIEQARVGRDDLTIQPFGKL